MKRTEPKEEEKEKEDALPAQFVRIFQFLEMCLHKLRAAKEADEECQHDHHHHTQQQQQQQQKEDALVACRNAIQQLEMMKPWDSLCLESETRDLLEQWVVQIRKDLLLFVSPPTSPQTAAS